MVPPDCIIMPMPMIDDGGDSLLDFLNSSIPFGAASCPRGHFTVTKWQMAAKAVLIAIRGSYRNAMGRIPNREKRVSPAINPATLKNDQHGKDGILRKKEVKKGNMNRDV